MAIKAKMKQIGQKYPKTLSGKCIRKKQGVCFSQKLMFQFDRFTNVEKISIQYKGFFTTFYLKPTFFN